MDEKLLEVRRLVALGKLEEAQTKIREIEDPYWRSYALKWIAEAYYRNPKKAIEIAEKIEVPSIRDEALKSLTYLFSRGEMFKDAIETARRIRNQFLRRKAFKTVGNFLAKSIIAKGIAEIKLSELNLDERDIEDLKPLPYGLVYKDGKLMPGAKVLRLKGEIREGVIERLEQRKKFIPPTPEFKEEEAKKLEYVSEYVLKLIEKGDLKEAENLAKGLPEPMKSYLLEEIGIKYMETGKIDEAERIFNDLSTANVLGSLLAREHIEDPSKVKMYLRRIHNPATRLMLAYEVTKTRGVDEEFLNSALMWATDEWKKGRILKFLAFEMLEEAKKTNNNRLRDVSRELFELGQRTEETAIKNS